MSGEDRAFRQFSHAYRAYHRAVDDRTFACFSGLSGKLLLAGGGDLPDTHVTIAKRFSAVSCLDISERALEIARAKLGPRARYVLGSIVKMPLVSDSFDAVFCAHVVYHIDRELQEQAVAELIRVTRPGGRVVVVYGNPDSLIKQIITAKSKVPLVRHVHRRSKARSAAESAPARERPPLYFALHPLPWWKRFAPGCAVRFVPWDVMGSGQEQELMWFDAIAAAIYRLCGWVERKYPALAVRWWRAADSEREAA
jgi:SAM-dependent methyltransferase